MQTILVREWLLKFTSEELIELQGKPVAEQLKFYDLNGSGVGFIIYLVPMVEDAGDHKENPMIEYHLKTQPVVKMRNDWYTPEDENVTDILSSVIRMLNQ